MSIKEATRDSYGKALSEFAEEYDLYVLDADLAAATKTGIFKKAYPERFIECGIAEGNMMGVAAGLAAAGKTVFASTFAMFAAGRAFEQIRNSIGYPHLNVKIGATHAGISVGEDGATHQCNEDIALMRTIPGMVVLNPADPVEARLCVKAVDSIFDENYQFEIGRGVVLKEGKDVAIIATGLMTQRALKAAEILSLEGIAAAVINMASIKPLDNDLVLRYAAKCGAIVTTEEHSVIGGLGGAVCELICEQGKCPVIRHGVEDQFGKSGPAADLLDLFELNAEGIAEKARYAVSLKK